MKEEKNETNMQIKHFYDKIWVKIIFQIIITIVTLIIVAWWAESFSHTVFEITDYSQNVNNTTYTTIKNNVTYTGSGIITTNNKKDSYIVILKETLKSGGSNDKEKYKPTYNTIIVSNGKGNFYTYDSGDEGEITKPNYDFEILGYVTLN